MKIGVGQRVRFALTGRKPRQGIVVREQWCRSASSAGETGWVSRWLYVACDDGRERAVRASKCERVEGEAVS